MARDSSPLSKRLKALAVRAGLPVDSGQTNGSAAPAPHSGAAPTPDDEQPTGEFPAVATSDTPDDDRPTGEFPAVTSAEEPSAPTGVQPTVPDPATEVAPSTSAEQPTATFGGAVPPPPREQAPEPTSDIEPPRPTVPPIWTDSPPESQSPLTATTPDGPTLSPPTLPSLAKSTDPAENADEPAAQSAAPVEPATTLHEVVSEQPNPGDLGGQTAVATDASSVDDAEEPASRAAALDEALALEPDPADEAPSATDTRADHESAEAGTDVQADEDAGATTTAAETEDQTGADAANDSALASVDTSEANPSDDTSSPEPAPAPVDKLSLTGRIAAIRRRIRPDAPPATEPAALASPAAATAAAPSVDEEPAPPAPVTVAEPTPAAESEPDEHFAKPSFSERAALRRRVKTLRARRDAGLLELGAITIDQRRFGDPTAGTLLRRRTDELVDLDNEIAAIEYALEEHASATAIAALGTVRCLGCGTLVGPVDRYCAHCGTPRPTDAAPSERRPDQPS